MKAVQTLILLCLGTLAQAQNLTLEQTLNQAARQHPQQHQAQAQLQLAQASNQRLLAEYGLTVWLEADARWIDLPENSLFQNADDSRISLNAEKTLFDFGRKQALKQSGEALLQAAQAGIQDTDWQVEEEAARAYFDVLLADLAFNTANEAMSIAYIRYDRAQERLELEQVSELEVARLQARYQDTRLAVRAAEQAQRLSRERLALLLGSETDPPAELEIPILELDRQPPDFERLLPQLQHNARLAQLQARLQSLRAQARAASRGNRPSIKLDAIYTQYQQTFGSRSPGRVSLVLNWPFLDGGQARSQSAELEAQVAELEARIDLSSRQLRANLLEALQQINRLQLELQRNLAYRDYRELYLDKSRALYEMEVKTDLGDAMVQQSRVQLDTARTRYQLALAWLKLARLTNQPQWKAWKH